MPIFTAIATTALAVAGITSSYCGEAEIVEIDEHAEDDEGDDE
ncbi:hypothetical protein GGD65_005299 [Bradyrhizobium sp. CIR18]|nr:hypothetical protein [Bradyrhizobium sp. CIR18]MBB4364241.1 hypothetical protein [Bradyrhizobium sp. CIR18]